MDWEWVFVNFLRIMFIVTSPITFLVGVYLLYDIDTYKRIEKFLKRSYGSSKKLISNLERNRESFQLFLLEKRRLVGVVCILNSLFAIFTTVFNLRRY